MKHLARSPILHLVAVFLLSAISAQAQFPPSSDLLLPYFEVDLDGQGTTLFAVVNTSDEPVEVRATLHTNWGIAMLDANFTLSPQEVKTVNLASWLVGGNLPDRKLQAEEIDHLQAAFCGQISPRNDQFYGTEKAFRVAVGYVTVRTLGRARPDVLIGDYFVVDPSQDYAQGQVLVDIDPTAECPGLCRRHALRFLAGGGFDSGTEIIIWTPRVGEPNTDGIFPEDMRVVSETLAFNEAGERIDTRQLGLLAVEVVKVADLGFREDFGWLDLLTEESSFITVRYSASNRYSVGLKTFCLPLRQAGIRIEKETNGVDADRAPGPTIAIGDPVEWTYRVTNIGNTHLTSVTVTDDQDVAVSCPKDTLASGESMTCTGSGTAQACQYSNIGIATGTLPDGSSVTASDRSHYFGRDEASIEIETHTNGQDADGGPGPEIAVGDPVTWTYRVENIGAATLRDIVVTDDQGTAVDCPQSRLNPGQSMTCTGSGTADLGLYENLGTVTATTGGSCPVTVSDTDPSHYKGTGDECSEHPAIDLEKATNGWDADSAPGPVLTVGDAVSWTYRVANTGDVALNSIVVADDQGVSVSCPESSLPPGSSMTCTGFGTATPGQYKNVGTVTAESAGSCPATVSDADPSHYMGEEEECYEHPAISLEKSTNGHDADSAPGPELTVGDAVTWTYLVENTGDVPLNWIAVSDDQGVAVSCPESSLAVGSSMTCTGHGTATLGQYRNIGTVTAESATSCPATVSDSDASHYKGKEKECTEHPAIDLEKATNGHDADSAPGPELTVGDAVSWTYQVRNTGDVSLLSIVVSDDQGVAVSCPKSSLSPGSSMTCTGHGTAVLGQYKNVGTVTAQSAGSCPATVSDADSSHYKGFEPPPVGGQGCTPGYWKQSHHADSWPPAGYSTGQLVKSVFGEASAYPQGSSSLVEALKFQGNGAGIEASVKKLLRASVAGLLNAAHPGVSYPWTEGDLIAAVDKALASADSGTMLDLKDEIDRDNNGGCPLN